MAEFKLVLCSKDGKSSQKIVKDKEASVFLKKKIGEKISGKELGMEGYELEITGGSDNCGFPMRKGIQQRRQRIMIGKGVGFSGKDRNKKKQKGLRKKRRVCGERIDSSIVQINLKVLGGEASGTKKVLGGKASGTKRVLEEGKAAEEEKEQAPKEEIKKAEEKSGEELKGKERGKEEAAQETPHEEKEKIKKEEDKPKEEA